MRLFGPVLVGDTPTMSMWPNALHFDLSPPRPLNGGLPCFAKLIKQTKFAAVMFVAMHCGGSQVLSVSAVVVVVVIVVVV